jgi:hypothetical protein
VPADASQRRVTDAVELVERGQAARARCGRRLRAGARGRNRQADKLIEAAQARWRCVNGPHLVALVRAGAIFVNGKLVERPANGKVA